MASYHNISGLLTQELLAPGDDVVINNISLANVHADTPCLVDLYVEQQLTGKFYIIKNLQLPVGTTLILEDSEVKFNNKANGFGLYINLTATLSETPLVDVIIS